MTQQIETVLVFAGNSVQFSRYVNGRRDKNYVHVRRTSDIMGRRDYTIFMTGTWYGRKANHRLLELAKQRLETHRTK